MNKVPWKPKQSRHTTEANKNHASQDRDDNDNEKTHKLETLNQEQCENFCVLISVLKDKRALTESD